MKVLCHANRGLSIPTNVREGYCSEETKFPVKVGEIFDVYAMVQRIDSPLLEFLIVDRFDNAFYVPSDLFTVLETKTPYFWGYNEWHHIDTHFHYRVWGYPEILKYEHHEGIIESRKNDLKILAAAKKRTDDCLWFGKEQEVLNQLLKANGITFDTNRVLVEKRDYDKLSLKTFFLSPYDFTCPANIKADKTVTVSVNDGAFEGECMLLMDGNRIYGMELFPIDAEIPCRIDSIKLL